MKHFQNTEQGVKHRKQGPPESGGLLGRLAEQSPLTGYEPNMTFDPHTSGDTPANPTSRRTSFRSATTSAENVLTMRELLSAESTQKVCGS